MMLRENSKHLLDEVFVNYQCRGKSYAFSAERTKKRDDIT